MQKSLLVFVVVGCTCYINKAISQENQVNLSLKPKFLLNKLDVSHDDFLNDALSSNNQFGGSMELSYSKITKSGFTYGGAIDFGYHTERINIHYPDLNELRPAGELGGKSYNKSINTGFAYSALGANIGYYFSINESDNLSVEIGAKKLIPFISKKDNVSLTAISRFNSGEELNLAFYDRKFSNKGHAFVGPILLEGAVTYHFSNGKRRYFVGLLGTLNSIGFNKTSGEKRVLQGNFVLKDFIIDPWGIRYGSEGQKNYYEVVTNKFASIGLKIGMNLFTF